MVYKTPKSSYVREEILLSNSSLNSHLKRSHSGTIQLFSSTCSSWNKQATYSKKSYFSKVFHYRLNTCFYLMHTSYWMLPYSGVSQILFSSNWSLNWVTVQSGVTGMLYAVATFHLSFCFLQQLFLTENLVQSDFRSQIYLLSIHFSSPSNIKCHSVTSH